MENLIKMDDLGVQGNFQVPPKMVPLSHKAPIGFP